MAHIENILRDKLFVFSGTNKTTETENEILSLVAAKENLGDIKKNSLIDNGENFDSYKLETSNGEYLVKLSLDESYADAFEKEVQILGGLSDIEVAPEEKGFGVIEYGSKILYLITSFEEAHSANELGRSILFSNHEECLKLIHLFHQKKIKTIGLKDRIQEIFAATNFETQPEFAELVKAATPNYNLLLDEITGLKQYIQDTFKDNFNGKSFCHGNLTPSTVLLGAKKIRFINWQNAFLASPLIDLSNLRMEFDFGEDFEFKMFKYYASLGSDYSWDEYLEARRFWAAIKLLEYVFSYIKEIFLFRSMRQDKILKIFSSFCRNIKFFEHIPTFQKNKEALLNLFSAPML